MYIDDNNFGKEEIKNHIYLTVKRSQDVIQKISESFNVSIDDATAIYLSVTSNSEYAPVEELSADEMYEKLMGQITMAVRIKRSIKMSQHG